MIYLFMVTLILSQITVYGMLLEEWEQQYTYKFTVLKPDGWDYALCALMRIFSLCGLVVWVILHEYPATFRLRFSNELYTDPERF